MEVDSITHESPFHCFLQEEYVWDNFDDYTNENMAIDNDFVDTFSNVFSVPNYNEDQDVHVLSLFQEIHETNILEFQSS